MFIEKRLFIKNGPRVKYSPHQGFIGKTKLTVPNYLFTSKKEDTGYAHCKKLVDYFMSRSVEEQYQRSKELTDFLKKRELTFSKKTKSGEYKIFTVPCTTTPLSLPKSLFNRLESSAQMLVASLRYVLQDIYGNESVSSSQFVQSLPKAERDIFIDAIESSPHYFKALHHPVMKNYPFFDVVGLDLVLTEDLPDAYRKGPRLVSPPSSSRDAGDMIPFRLLEINAGSPSGAANNQHILEGLARIQPEILKTIGRVMPNDHFEVLGDTYRTLGNYWTGRTDGVQIILPPGGESGAAPEIHQLAALSGLIYADAGQLYSDPDGMIRLRTVQSSQGEDPVVTAVYSRVNSDSALYDPSRDIFLRDAETGEMLYSTDPLSGEKNIPIRDRMGNPIPQESYYAIPNAIEAIHNRKLYLGGLNRILDNKIILSSLTQHAPLFFRARLCRIGLNPVAIAPISPPDTLPSTAESLEIVLKNPEDWVIKTPNLSGGNGVYILKTMSEPERRDILHRAKLQPSTFAYQKLVRIGRLPVAIKLKGNDYRYANLAADLRMWAFFGAGENAEMDTLPRLTHNALIRTAPEEKGPLSSIVNTSKGGGYAPMLVVDDMQSAESISIEEFLIPKLPVFFQGHMPSFAAAQLIQIAHLIQSMRDLLSQRLPQALHIHEVAVEIRHQCREILSFMHPRNMEPMNEVIELLERKAKVKSIEHYFEMIEWAKIRLTSLMIKFESDLNAPFFATIDKLRILSIDLRTQCYSDLDQAYDHLKIVELRQNYADLESMASIFSTLDELVETPYPLTTISSIAQRTLLLHIENFSTLAQDHLNKSKAGKPFLSLFIKSNRLKIDDFCPLFDRDIHLDKTSSNEQKSEASLIASHYEHITGQALVDSKYVAEELREARQSWMQVLDLASSYSEMSRPGFLERARIVHFERYPFLAEYQEIIDAPHHEQNEFNLSHTLKMLEIQPYAKFNLTRYADFHGVTLSDLFTRQLEDRKIAILDKKARIENQLSSDLYAGEAFAQKNQKHGLFSDSKIYLWVAEELPPIVQAYTLGHEIIHMHQIASLMEDEKKALAAGPLEFAKFLNFFGNYLSMSSGTIESASADIALDRKPIYGLPKCFEKEPPKGSWIADLKRSLKNITTNDLTTWNDAVTRFGAVVGYSTLNNSSVKAKALREVIPAIENAKNIRFMKDLGLVINRDEIKAALPSANSYQVERNRELISQSLFTGKLDFEVLRIIANHQYSGILFPKSKDFLNTLTLKPLMSAIYLGGSYNQTQQ